MTDRRIAVCNLHRFDSHTDSHYPQTVDRSHDLGRLRRYCTRHHPTEVATQEIKRQSSLFLLRGSYDCSYLQWLWLAWV